MNIKKSAAAILSLGLCLPLLAGCGGSSNSNNSETKASSGTSASNVQESKNEESKNDHPADVKMQPPADP